MKHYIFLFVALYFGLLTQLSSQTTELDSNVIKQDIQFYSNGFLLKGWLFLPADTIGNKFPVIVMAPGFSGVKECNYQFIAGDFAQSGLAVVLFDYPNFGESEGRFRQEADPTLQIQAYRDAIGFAVTHPQIDPVRVGVWGGSYSGGHAIVVSALDSRVKCFVAMTPYVSGYALVKHHSAATSQFLQQQFNADRFNRMQGKAPAMIPVATKNKGEFSAVGSMHAWNFVQDFTDYAPNYQNQVTLKSLEMELEYEPGTFIERTGTKPKLFLLASQDELLPESLIMSVYDRAAEPKSVATFVGNHFSAYMEQRKEVSRLAIDFFRKNL
jgi:dienelactone hydrolase